MAFIFPELIQRKAEAQENGSKQCERFCSLLAEY